MSHVSGKPTFDFLHQLADLAGETVMPLFRTPMEIENKEQSGFDPVTDADKNAERKMRDLIAAHYPEHGVEGEEFEAHNPDAESIWILDPIDGTRAFISGLPTWGTLIGLQDKTGPNIGMMSQPFTQERYFGDGRESFYRGPGGARKLAVRSCPELAQATMFTTAPEIFQPDELAAFRRVEDQVRLSRYGVDCYAYCMVALGMADLVIEAGLKSVDILPLIPVIEGAGGIVTDWQGGPVTGGGQAIACGDKTLHKAALELLSSI